MPAKRSIARKACSCCNAGLPRTLTGARNDTKEVIARPQTSLESRFLSMGDCFAPLAVTTKEVIARPQAEAIWFYTEDEIASSFHSSQ
jgi:hypothetical protein